MNRAEETRQALREAPWGDSLVGILPCGCLVAWMSRSRPEAEAEIVAEWIKSGYSVHPANLEAIRHLFRPCDCPTPPKRSGGANE